MESVKQQTIKSAKWNFIDRIVSQGVDFLLGIIIARFLAPTDYCAVGVLAITQSFDLYIYTRGFQIASGPNNVINGGLGTVTYPILVINQDDEAHLIHVYRKYIRITSLCIFVFSGILCALAKPIVLFCLTQKSTFAVVFFLAFSLLCIFYHLRTINLNLLIVKGKSDLCFKLKIIKKIVAVFINTYYSVRLFHLGYIQQMKDILPFFICCVGACLPAYAITFLNLPHVVTISVGTILALFLYWFMLRKNTDMLELVELVKIKVRGR